MSSAVPAAEPVHVAIDWAIAAAAGGPMAARTLGEAAECVKTFPGTTLFFAGHFPGTPMVPGVILVEALAQTAGLAAGQPGRSFRLTAIKAMKFPAAAGPDEEVRLHAKKAVVVGGL